MNPEFISMIHLLPRYNEAKKIAAAAFCDWAEDLFGIEWKCRRDVSLGRSFDAENFLKESVW